MCLVYRTYLPAGPRGSPCVPYAHIKTAQLPASLEQCLLVSCFRDTGRGSPCSKSCMPLATASNGEVKKDTLTAMLLLGLLLVPVFPSVQNTGYIPGRSKELYETQMFPN